jgi:ADP-dependent NAD(P)H-hydrate dehydratase / NAD(P)H-hydrate epimerase
MKILTSAQMRRIDKVTTERYGIPSLTLMENAGKGVVSFLAERFAPLAQHRIAVLCGRGNNGGDGLVTARLLREWGLTPEVFIFTDPQELKGDAATNYQRLLPSGPPEVIQDPAEWQDASESLAKATLVVDALLGTGLSKPLQGFLLEVVRYINGLSAAKRVAVDLPSGLSADTGELIGECVEACASVTFTAPKYAHVFPPACEKVGEWRVLEIGTPRGALEDDPELFLRLTGREDLKWLTAPRKIDSHKGSYGHVLIVAGSVGKTGAAAMAAKAALRAGAGLVTIATPRTALPVVASLGLEWMTAPLPETEDGTVALRSIRDGTLDRLAEGKSVLAIGPGLGNGEETAEFVREAVNHSTLPIVLDADGLNAFAGRMGEIETGARARILTPHPGEMARLVGSTAADVQDHRVEVAREFVRQYKIYLVLKGSRTLICSPDGQVAVNPTGNPGMATGGTGDCLTGLIAGLLAEFSDQPVANVVEAAVYLHGLAGDCAARKVGQVSLIASDLLDAIPEALRSI